MTSAARRDERPRGARERRASADSAEASRATPKRDAELSHVEELRAVWPALVAFPVTWGLWVLVFGRAAEGLFVALFAAIVLGYASASAGASARRRRRLRGTRRRSASRSERRPERLARGVRRIPERRARLRRAAEWALVVYTAVGVWPLLVWLGFWPGLLGFLTGFFALLAVVNRLDTWAADAMWTPGARSKEARRRRRIARGRGVWSADPPRALRLARVGFLVLLVAAFAGLLLWPATDESGRAAYERTGALFVGVVATGLFVLGVFERRQAKAERAWLARRRAERRGASAPGTE